MKCFKPTLVALALATLLPLAAHAHRGWLVPNVAEVEGQEPWVTITGAISEDLFVADHRALALDKLTITGPDGKPRQPEALLSGRQFSAADVKLADPGTYRISLVSETAMASYKLKGEAKRWRGTPEMLAKEVPADAEELQVTTTRGRMDTYVTANQPTDGVLQPSGEGLELLPLDHPTGLLAGQKTRFRVLLDGKPVAGLTVAVVPGGVRYRGLIKETAVVSDSQGNITVTWPMAQVYWLSTSYPPRAAAPAEGAARAAAPAKRHSYSATFEVLPE